MPLAYNQSGMGFFRDSLPGWLCVIVAASCAAQAPGPIQMEQSNTTASLRGIHAAGPGVAWASGTNGTVLRTEDGGFVWQGCAMPPGAEKLDFRGVWAWDAMTAIVMSSGPGDQSRLYKTTDGCVTWKLLATNTDKDGFWDAIVFSDRDNGFLLGDPVDGKYVLRMTKDDGLSWKPVAAKGLEALPGAGVFAASNSSLAVVPRPYSLDHDWIFGTGSSLKAGNAPEVRVYRQNWQSFWHHSALPLAEGHASSGLFSIEFRGPLTGIAVGGDYLQPNDTSGTAAFSGDRGVTWTASARPPHGYRSAVAWDRDKFAWITAGPNGTDYSWDDGTTWLPLENGAWNAISLPYLVGPDGRIGKLVALPQTRPPFDARRAYVIR